MSSRSDHWKFGIALLVLVGVALSQSSHKTRTLVINGHTGDAIVYEIDGKSFVDLESLVRIASGSLSFRGNQILLNLPASDSSAASTDGNHASTAGLSNDFMRDSVQCLTVLKEWTGVLAYAAQHGTPGDGSRIALVQDRATQALNLSKVEASTSADQNAFQLLNNQFNAVKGWSDKLVGERKSMDTGKYSMTENAMSKDETYQKITACSKFLGAMLPSGHFQDDYSCH